MVLVPSSSTVKACVSLWVKRADLTAGDVVDRGTGATGTDVDTDDERSLGVFGRDVEVAASISCARRGDLDPPRVPRRVCRLSGQHTRRAPALAVFATGCHDRARGRRPASEEADLCRAAPKPLGTLDAGAGDYQTDCPMYSPSAQPGGIANTAEPIGVVHWFSRSSASSLRWIGRNCPVRSAWQEYEDLTRLRRDADPEPGDGASS